MFPNIKTDCHESIHDCATDMKTRIVGRRFLTQGRIAYVIELFEATSLRANFLTAVVAF